MQKPLLSLTLLIWIFGGAFASAAAQGPSAPRIIGDDDYPPYSYAGPDGAPQGIYADLIAEVLRRMPDQKAEVDVLPWKRAVASVESGRALAVFPPYRWPEERPWMGYSDPIGVEQPVVVCRRDLDRSGRRDFPADYAGLRFVSNLGFLTAGQAYRRMVEAGRIEEIQVSGTADALKRLLNGQADCYVNDSLSMEAALTTLPNGAARAKELVITNRLPALQAHLGFRAEKGEVVGDEFRDRFNRILREVKADGTLARIVEAHRPDLRLTDADPR